MKSEIHHDRQHRYEAGYLYFLEESEGVNAGGVCLSEFTHQKKSSQYGDDYCASEHIRALIGILVHE